MDLAYGPEYQAFAAEVDAFLEAHRGRWPQAIGATREQVLSWQKSLIAHGYAARTIPKAYGGYGAEPDILKSRIIAESFTRAGAPGGLAGQGISMLVPTLLEVGTEEQKQRWIAPSPGGADHGCGARPIRSPGPARTSPPFAPMLSRTATIS